MRVVGLRLTGSRRLVTVQTGMWRAPLLLLAGVTLLAGCTKSAQATHGRHPWSRAGVLRVAIGEEPKNLNPLLAGTVPEIFVDRLMFEPLISADAHGNPVPILAQTVPTQANGGISRDGLTINYRLRHDVRWSDGVALTARDVRWSWQAIENPNNDVVSRHGYDDVASIDLNDNALEPLVIVASDSAAAAPSAPKSHSMWAAHASNAEPAIRTVANA